MSHKDNAAIAIMIKQEQRIRELEDALAELVKEIESVGFGEEWDSYDTARAALAKARGEE